jgi:hypothetical protein
MPPRRWESKKDFAECRLATAEELASRPFVFRMAVRVARLLAPIL